MVATLWEPVKTFKRENLWKSADLYTSFTSIWTDSTISLPALDTLCRAFPVGIPTLETGTLLNPSTVYKASLGFELQVFVFMSFKGWQFIPISRTLSLRDQQWNVSPFEISQQRKNLQTYRDLQHVFQIKWHSDFSWWKMCQGIHQITTILDLFNKSKAADLLPLNDFSVILNGNYNNYLYKCLINWRALRAFIKKRPVLLS